MAASGDFISFMAFTVTVTALESVRTVTVVVGMARR